MRRALFAALLFAASANAADVGSACGLGVVHDVEGLVCYLRCSGNQTLAGSLTVRGAFTQSGGAVSMNSGGSNIVLTGGGNIQLTTGTTIFGSSGPCTISAGGFACTGQSWSALVINTQDPADGTAFVGLISAENDATGVGARIGTSDAAPTSGMKLAQFCTAASSTACTEKAYIDKDGAGVFNGNLFGSYGAAATLGRATLRATANVTVVGTGADTTEDNLMTYSLPANSLSANTLGLRIIAWGDGVSTADVTTARCYFGATNLVTRVLTASQANTWKVEAEVMRTGSNTQISTAQLLQGGAVTAVVQTNAAPAETDSGAITIKCTGQRATSSVANSVRELGLIVEAW